jgi:hypothetical protein
MKRKFILVLAFFISLTSCIKRPVDDLDLLITNQSSCYIGNFFLYGSDHINCLVPTKTVVDTVNLTINAVAKFGTNLKNVKPAVSLSIDSKLTPAMGNWMDFTLPKKYTVISGNRQVKKEYTITVVVEG